MDFTGSTKYFGFSADLRRVSAGGEDAARRAMPTNRALARSGGAAASFRTGPFSRFWFPLWVVDAGGQSVVSRSEMLPRRSSVRAGLWTTCFGLLASGHSGKSPAVVGETWRRRVRKLGAAKIGRAHVLTPVTVPDRMPSSA